MFSHSFYLDLGTCWDEARQDHERGQNAKDFENGVKQASRFLPGTSIDKLLTQSGVHHRFVVANPTKIAYKTEPQVTLPAFGFVTTMRDPAFGKSVEIAHPRRGCLANTQVSFKLVEEKHDDVPIVRLPLPRRWQVPRRPAESAIQLHAILCRGERPIRLRLDARLLQRIDRLSRRKTATRSLSPEHADAGSMPRAAAASSTPPPKHC